MDIVVNGYSIWSIIITTLFISLILTSISKKIATLRIFADENGKTNLSVKDVGGEVLLVSQFTLAGEFYHGNRPSFSNAEDFEIAKDRYNKLAKMLTEQYDLSVKLGVFGEDMIISQTNHGPFTAYLEKWFNV